jgi:multidrug resistance efflux pump
MRRVLAPVVVIALALLLATDSQGRAVAAAMVEAAPAAKGKKPSHEIDPEKFRASSASVSLEVPDPVKAHGDAERTLVKLGADVISSSASTDSGHLSVRIDERRLQSALDALRSLPGRVGNVNRNLNDFAQSARTSAERLRRLDLADAEITRAIKSAADADAVDGLMLLRELSQNDRMSHESQIDSLRQESERAQLHISFSVLR